MTEILLWVIAICALFITLVLIIGITYVYTAINRFKSFTRIAGRNILIGKIIQKIWRSRR